jgi:hypothetical protein
MWALPFVVEEPFTREVVHKLERKGGERSFARRISLLEGSNHKWTRTSRPCHDTPEEKEDTVESITMINGAMPGALMG